MNRFVNVFNMLSDKRIKAHWASCLFLNFDSHNFKNMSFTINYSSFIKLTDFSDG